jgi:hypothetical protein
VNLSVSGILLKTAPRYHCGECLELEIDFLVRRGMITILRGIGDVVRHVGNRRDLAAIQFDASGASIVRSERAAAAS